MNLSKPSFCQPARLALVLCFTLAIFGCSGSSSPTTNPVSNEQAEGSDDEPFDASATTPDTGDAVSDADDIELPENGISDDAPDPMVQNYTEVTFEITVPVYQSNELQLQLSWGESSTSLNWVGDEFWTANAILPTNTWHKLSIIFFDENGGIKLGSFERQYRTGINAAEVYQVNADQFDTDRWNIDGDGASNLDELIAGTDPRVYEESTIPIIDNQPMSLLFIANYFESVLPNERPYMGTEDDTVSDDAGSITTADIDANGNGSMSVETLPRARRNNRKGERLVLENGVKWSGSWSYSEDYSFGQVFDSEISVDGDKRRLVEEGQGSWIGYYSHRWETTVDVTGQLIEGSAYCKIASGTITESYNTNIGGSDSKPRELTTLTVTRESVDDFWHVSKVFESRTSIGTIIEHSEYYARELSMHMIRFGYQVQVSENDHFFCDFADL